MSVSASNRPGTSGPVTRYRVRDWDRGSFPALYRAADDASINCQKIYIALIAFDLILMVVGAALSTIGFADPHTQQVVLWSAVTAFLVGLFVSALLAVKRWDRVWFSGRAVAESVKSLAWKFATCANPFPVGLEDGKATRRLLDMFQELLGSHKELQPHLVGGDILEDHATEWMREVRRAVAPQVRRDVYLAQRVYEQQGWYADRAALNRRMQSRWFLFFILAQAVALVFGVVAATHPEWNSQPSGAFAALAAAIVGWVQVRRFQELAQTYGQAALELGFIAEKSRDVSSEKDLSRLVVDAEAAISREHTGWVARRETV